MSSQSNARGLVGILTGDDNLTVFADGRLVGGNGGVWNAARWFSFSSKTKVIALSVNNPVWIGGFLGVFSNGVVTDKSWKCKETNNPENGWEETNFTDNAWPYAYIREDNSGLGISERVDGIPSNVYWISPANYYATMFICRRRFSTEEGESKSTLISILGYYPTHTISLYLDGVFTEKAVGSMTIVKDQHNLQAVQVEDSPVTYVFFLASSSNGVRTNQLWKCTNVYHKGWFLPSYNDTSWNRPRVTFGNFQFIAPDARWIGYLTRSNKLFCRRNTLNTTVGKEFISAPSQLPSTSQRPEDPGSTDKNELSTLVIVVIAVGGVVMAVIIGLAVSCYIWRRRRNKRGNDDSKLQKKNQRIDKWEVKGDDVTICEELGHGAFGKVCKGIMKVPSCMRGGSFPQITLKKKTKSTITVAVKMLQENATPDQKKDFLDEINLMKAIGSHKNIVSLIGCCIKSSLNFLIVEFASHGDLLSYLRARRKKIKDTKVAYADVRESPPQTTPTRSLNQKNAGSVSYVSF
ncbi:uncharacterized protein LOC144645823 [Oculina patagonica]